MKSLIELYRDHHGKVSDRWSLYLSVYNRLFTPWRDKPVHLLEIGIQNGGSLEIWSQFFHNAQKLVGCDIDLACENLRYEDPRIAVVVADATTDEGQQRVSAISAKYDLIIDDGSHHSDDIISSFMRYFSSLSEGGLFIVEDLHCGYWQEFAGGLHNPYSSIAFFKRLADIINHEHWGIDKTRSAYLNHFKQHYGIVFDDLVLQNIHSIEFLNSLCVIKKNKHDNNVLGKRIVAGTLEAVTTDARRFHGIANIVHDQSQNKWANRVIPVEEELQQQYGQIDGLIKTINDRDDQIAVHAKTIAKHQQQITDLVQTIDERDRQIASYVKTVAEQQQQITELTQTICERDCQIASHVKTVAEQQQQITGLTQTICERDHQIASHEKLIAKQQQQITGLAQVIADRDYQISELMLERSTYGARLGRLISRIRRRYFPQTSLRCRILTYHLHLAEKLYRYGFWNNGKSFFSTFRFYYTKKMKGDNPGNPLRLAEPTEYASWIENQEPSAKQLDQQRHTVKELEYRPLISIIIPVYKVPIEVLKAAIASLLRQTYPVWEACISYADLDNKTNWKYLQELAKQDSRIRLHRMAVNEGISGNSNAAFAMAHGEFVALLDHDDELTPWALYDMVIRIIADPEIDFLYSDKDCINESGDQRQNPLFKPSWSPEMLYSVNYLTHFNVMRRSIVEAVGNWRPETDGAQDWDIFYRVTEQSRKIARVPGIHYHWRIISTSTATGLSAKPYAALGQLRTQEDRIKRLALPATVLPDMDGGFRLLWRLEVKPCLDLVVRGRADSVQLNRFLTTLSKELDDLVSSITLVRHSGDSEGQYTPEIFGSTPFYQFTYDSPLDETDAIVKASHNGTAPVIVFVDSEIVSFGENWLRELTGWVHLHPDISFAGAIVLEKNEVVVECGRVVGENGRSLPLFRNMPLRHWSWFGGPLWFRNVSAVSPCTAACKREDWNNTKGMDDNTKPWMETFTTRCKAMLIRGRRGLVTPHARVYLDSMPDEPLPAWDDSFTKDPYFHPAFRSVTPLMLKE